MAKQSLARSMPEPEIAGSGHAALKHISAACTEPEAAALRQNPNFMFLIGQIPINDTCHLSLNELRSLIQCRRQAPDNWELPGHLAACPLCLDLFEILQGAEPTLSDQARNRYQRLFVPPMCSSQRCRTITPWLYPLAAMAASLLIVATGIYLLQSGPGQMPGKILDGSGHLVSGAGSTLSAGGEMPARQEIVTETGMNLALSDGSRITVAPQSQFCLVTSWIGNSTFYLSRGELNLAVNKQTVGRTLSVRTPLGEALVVGTRFRVKTIDNNTLVYQQIAGNSAVRSYRECIQSVEIIVTEGVVKVRNPYDEVLVRAGYRALLRGDQRLIGLYPANNESAR